MCDTYHILKFADDTVTVSRRSSEDISNIPAVDSFSSWCHGSFLVLNVSKMKHMCIDLRRSHLSTDSAVIDGLNIETAES